MQTRTSLMALVSFLVAGLTLAACDDSEQNRVLRHEPGVYKGQADTQLTEEQREMLRQRAAGQSGN